jgi:hypothetical protein
VEAWLPATSRLGHLNWGVLPWKCMGREREACGVGGAVNRCGIFFLFLLLETSAGWVWLDEEREKQPKCYRGR